MLQLNNPIVFLHGLGITEGTRETFASDPYAGWEIEGSNRGLVRQLSAIYGIKDDAVIENNEGNLRHLMEGDLPSLPAGSLWFLSYYSPIAALYANGAEHGIPAFANFLALALLRIQRATGGAPLNLICHSLGGLVARYALQRVLPGLGIRPADVVARFITVASPHRGFGGRRDALLWMGRHCGLSRPEVEQARRRWVARELGGDHRASELEGIRLCAIVGTDNETLRTPFTSGFDGGGDGLVKAREARWRDTPAIHIYGDHSGIKTKYTLLHALVAGLEATQRLQVTIDYAKVLPDMGSFPYHFYLGFRLGFDNTGLPYSHAPNFPAFKGMYVDVGMNTEQVDEFHTRHSASALAASGREVRVEKKHLLDVPVWEGPEGNGRHFFQLSVWQFDFNTIDLYRRHLIPQRFLPHDVYTHYFDLQKLGNIDLGHCQLSCDVTAW